MALPFPQDVLLITKLRKCGQVNKCSMTRTRLVQISYTLGFSGFQGSGDSENVNKWSSAQWQEHGLCKGAQVINRWQERGQDKSMLSNNRHVTTDLLPCLLSLSIILSLTSIMSFTTWSLSSRSQCAYVNSEHTAAPFVYLCCWPRCCCDARARRESESCGSCLADQGPTFYPWLVCTETRKVI